MTEQFEHGYAVIIGVDDNETKDFALPTVAKDVEALHAVIVDPERCRFKPENVKLINGKEATKTNIFNALLWLQKKAEIDREITAVIYYAGHGWKDKKNNQYNLIPYTTADTITAEEFAAKIKAIKSERTFVALDCYDADETDSESVENVPFPVDLFDDSTYVMLSTSSSSQPSYRGADGEMSAFAYQVIETLAPVYEMMMDEASPVALVEMDEFPPIMLEDVEPEEGLAMMEDFPLMMSIMFDDAEHEAIEDSPPILMADVVPAVDEPLVQSRRLEAAMPSSVHVGDTTELLVMIPRATDLGLLKHLPKETKAGDMITADDMSTIDVDVEFLESKKPILVYIKVGVHSLDFKIEEAVAVIQIFPNKQGAFATFLLTALRPVESSLVKVEFFVDKALFNWLGTIRLYIPITMDESGESNRFLKAYEQKLLYTSSGNSIKITNSTVNNGDTFNMSGNFQGANVNIKSILNNVTQSISTLPQADASAKANLVMLVMQLDALLNQSPSAEGAKLSEDTETLLKVAANENTNSIAIGLLGNGLKQTAIAFKDSLPAVVEVVTKIVTAVSIASHTSP